MGKKAKRRHSYDKDGWTKVQKNARSVVAGQHANPVRPASCPASFGRSSDNWTCRSCGIADNWATKSSCRRCEISRQRSDKIPEDKAVQQAVGGKAAPRNAKSYLEAASTSKCTPPALSAAEVEATSKVRRLAEQVDMLEKFVATLQPGEV